MLLSTETRSKEEDNTDRGFGFSLIELLISSAIMFFLLLGAGQLVLQSMLFEQKSDTALTAAEFISRKMERLKSLAYDGIDCSGQDRSEVLQGDGIHETYLLAWKCQEVSAGLKKITITCFPENEPREKTRSVLLLSQVLEF